VESGHGTNYVSSGEHGGGVDKELEQLTRDGTVPQDAYRAMREAIRRVTEQSGRSYEVGQEAHYQALAAAMALRAAGYSIEKTLPDG